MIDAMYDTDLQPARSLSGTRAQSRSGYNTTHHDPKKYFGSLSDDARPRDVLGGRATPRPIPTKTNTLHDPSLSPVSGEASSEGTPCLDNQACQSGWEILLPGIKGEARKKSFEWSPPTDILPDLYSEILSGILLAVYLTYRLTVYRTCILTRLLASPCYSIYLAFYLMYVLDCFGISSAFYLPFCPIFVLTFFLALALAFWLTKV